MKISLNTTAILQLPSHGKLSKEIWGGAGLGYKLKNLNCIIAAE